MTKPRVMFVDDEPRVLKALSRTFRREPWEIHMAESGEEALALEANHGPFDVLVTDQRMPGMCGIDLLKKFRQINPGCIRLILSGFADVGSLMDAINEGSIYKFLTKETKEEVLLQTVRDIVEGVELKRENRRLLARIETQSRDVEAMSALAREIASFEFDFEDESVLHVALDVLPVAVVVTNLGNIPLYLNAEARRLLRLSPDVPEAFDVPLQDLFPSAGGIQARSVAFGDKEKRSGLAWVLAEPSEKQAKRK